MRGRGLIPSDRETEVVAHSESDGKATFMVRGGEATVFVKKAPPHWWAVEARIQAAMAERCPDSVPAVLCELPEIGGFAMTYVAPAIAPEWVSAVRSAPTRAVAVAAHVGDHLGRLHRATLDCARIDAVAAANRRRADELRTMNLWNAVLHDDALAAIVRRTLADAMDCRIALAHGDIGLRNVLIRPDGIVLLDFEKAWFGDPAYDCGYMLSGILRLATRSRDRAMRGCLPDALRAAAAHWCPHVDWEPPDEAERRAVRVALIRHVAHHRLTTATGMRPPPQIAREIARIIELLHADADVDEVAMALADLGFVHGTEGRSPS